MRACGSPEIEAVIGALIVGTTVHIVLRMGEYWDSAPIPAANLVRAVVAARTGVRRGRLGIAVPSAGSSRSPLLTVIGALNSEASVVLPLLALVNWKRDNRAAVVLIAWIAVTAIVRFGIGGLDWPAPAMGDNLDHLPTAVINIGLFFGPAWLLALTGLRHTPSFARRSLVAAIPLIVAIAIFGSWWDVRLLSSLYPLAVPLILSALFEPAQLLK